MKRRLSYIMMVVLSAGVLASCNQEVIQDNSYGYLGLKMDNDPSADIIVKAGTADEIVFAVDVLNASGQSVASVEDHRTVTTENPIKLQIGYYDVVASNGENLNAAFDNPYYKGVKNVRIYPDKINTVNLTCTLANTIFSVEFPEEFDQHFDVYEVSVTNGIGDPLVLSNAPSSGNSLEAGFDAEAYFAVTGSLTWNLYLKNIEGTEYRHTVTYTDVKARQHYHLKFNLGEDVSADGAFVVKVTLDNTLDESSHELILDFDNRYLPSVSSNDEFAVESGEPVTTPVGNTISKVLQFSTPVGVQSLRITHDNDALVASGLPKSVELVGASATDLSPVGIQVSPSPGTKAVAAGAQGVVLDITTFVSKLPVGSYEMDFTVIDAKGHYDVFELVLEVISDVDAEAVAAYTGWACFAKLEGRYFNADMPEGMTFQYRKTSEAEWTEIDPSDMVVNAASLRYTTILFGLEPNAQYVFRAVSAEDKETKEITFSTAASATIHNLNFDSWSDSDKYPNASGYDIWDSANSSGAAITTKPVTDAVKGYAARLESVKAMGMMAAGNIFTGQFAGLAGLGAKLDWGTPFNARPIAVRGYYKYSPKTIDMAKAPYTDMKGQMDQSQIVVFLTDWTSQFRINTSSKEFVDLDNDPGIIALGQHNSSNADAGYVKFTLPLVYRDATRIPNFLVIAAASSRYGDYFTGGVGSVLYVDEFELIYDPAELTEDEYNKVFSKVSPF
jgi:hypothetical protein